MRKYSIAALGIAALIAIIIIRFADPKAATQTGLDAPTVETSEPALAPQPLPDPEPAPPATAPVTPPEKTVLQRVAQNDPTVSKLSAAQIHAFFTKNGTNAETLLAAFNATGDKAHLRHALELFPDSPLVLASALANDAAPEHRADLLARLKQLSPDNPLANYLSARDHLKHQQPDLALKEFQEAAAKTGFHDFTVERIQGLEEMYLASGYSPAEAKALAMTSIQLPSVAQLRELGREMSALQRQYADAGDRASADLLAQMGLALAGDIGHGTARSLLSEIVGTVVEREFLRGLDPNASYDFLPRPVRDRIAELSERERTIRDASRFVDQWMHTATDAQLVAYFDRLKLYGENAAINWARTQLAASTP